MGHVMEIASGTSGTKGDAWRFQRIHSHFRNGFGGRGAVEPYNFTLSVFGGRSPSA